MNMFWSVANQTNLILIAITWTLKATITAFMHITEYRTIYLVSFTRNTLKEFHSSYFIRETFFRMTGAKLKLHNSFSFRVSH